MARLCAAQARDGRCGASRVGRRRVAVAASVLHRLLSEVGARRARQGREPVSRRAARTSSSAPTTQHCLTVKAAICIMRIPFADVSPAAPCSNWEASPDLSKHTPSSAPCAAAGAPDTLPPCAAAPGWPTRGQASPPSRAPPPPPRIAAQRRVPPPGPLGGTPGAPPAWLSAMPLCAGSGSRSSSAAASRLRRCASRAGGAS